MSTVTITTYVQQVQGNDHGFIQVETDTGSAVYIKNGHGLIPPSADGSGNLAITAYVKYDGNPLNPVIHQIDLGEVGEAPIDSNTVAIRVHVYDDEDTEVGSGIVSGDDVSTLTVKPVDM